MSSQRCTLHAPQETAPSPDCYRKQRSAMASYRVINKSKISYDNMLKFTEIYIYIYIYYIYQSISIYIYISFRLALINPRGGVDHTDPSSPLHSIADIFFLQLEKTSCLVVS